MTDEDREKSQYDPDQSRPAGHGPDTGDTSTAGTDPIRATDPEPAAPTDAPDPAADTSVNATERPVPADHPVASEPAASEPVPADPAPTQPEPAQQAPADPAPEPADTTDRAAAVPASAGPAAADPEPTGPVLAGPVPDPPEPAQPVPAQPVPAEAVPAGPEYAAAVGQPVQPAPPGPDSPWQRPADDTGVGYPATHRTGPLSGEVTQSLPAGGYGQYGPPPPGGPAWGQPAGPWGPSRPPSKGRRWFAAGAAAVLLVIGGGVAGGATVNALQGDPVVESPVVSSNSASSKGPLASMVDKVMPTVVSLRVEPDGGTSGDEGSGVVIESDGMILTNDHVVSAVEQSGGSITVTFSDGKTAPAKIVGTDPAGDLAVVQAQGVSGRQVATLGDSSALHVGDGVIAIGSPLGLQGSVTEGIVSALNRQYTASDQPPDQGNPFVNPQQNSPTYTIPDAIQTDAAINPGNSGGPLLNMAGQVIGINSAIRGESNIGIGFAIPINTAKSTADALMAGKTVQHARLGVSVTDAVSDNSASSGQAQGAVVAAVSPGGPAAHAGLQKGDVITKVDGTTISDADSLVAAIATRQPGDKVTITYQRGGATHTATVTLGKQSD